MSTSGDEETEATIEETEGLHDSPFVPSNTSSPFHKVHTLTVCIVPPPEYYEVWQRISNMRETLQDPGYFRWPPHVNLLYPFLKCDQSKETLVQVVEQIHSATKVCPPFHVSMNSFGTFGGKHRGVLWLYPDGTNRVYSEENNNLHDVDENLNDDNQTPLRILHRHLEEAFPMCLDLSQKGEGGQFYPHMTLSHFETLQAARDAQTYLEKKQFSLKGLDFFMDRVYLLKRSGDGGQFERLAEVGLGPDSTTTIYDPPQRFPSMPQEEADWVYEERMKLKARRNGNGRGGGRLRRRRRHGARDGPNSGNDGTRQDTRKTRDSPEVIAAKRAERQAKRERLERERQLLEIERALQADDD